MKGNIGTFIRKLESAYEKSYSSAQGEEIYDRLGFFGDDELDAIYKWLTEHYTRKPLLPDMFTAARELGFFETIPRDTTKNFIEDFDATDCRLCGGQGLLRVVFSHWASEDGKHLRRRLERVGPYSRGFDDYEIPPGEKHYDYIARCSCEAGEREGLPRGWPRWRTEAQPSFKRAAAGERQEELDIMTDDDVPF